MKHIFRNLLILSAIGASLSANAGDIPSLTELAERLRTHGCYNADVTYEVLLPSRPDPVEYTLSLASAANSADSLAPASYLIRWDLDAPSGPVHGFSSYSDGDHYRFSNNRLQEYHHANNAAAFAPNGRLTDGVQWRAQFAELLPQTIGHTFATMASDTTYHYRIRRTNSGLIVDGTRRLMGFDAVEFEYTLDADSWLPLRVEMENNPGQLSEQTITARYTATPGTPACDFSLAALMAMEPDAFGRYRTDSYSLEQLVEQPLPQIALPTASGARYIHHKGDPMPAQTLLVFLETGVGSSPEVIEAVRQAVTQVPAATDVVWMFIDRHAEEVAEMVTAAPGETVVLNAGSAARDLGVGAVTPVIVIVDRNGTVADFIRGFNKDLRSVVIQKASLSGLR